MFTDPPYGVAYQNELSPEDAETLNRRKDGKEVTNDALTSAETQALIAASLTTARGLMRQGAAYYVCAPAGEMQRVFMDALDEAGMPMRHSLVWVKDRFAFGRSDYHYRHELILYGWLRGRAHYFVNDRTLDSVWEVARPSRSPEHPTMKPVELVERALTASSKRGAVVLDPFGGSGSTLIGCEVLGRRCFIAELDEGYCDVIRDRYERFVS
jgi:DNA modification methylase